MEAILIRLSKLLRTILYCKLAVKDWIDFDLGSLFIRVSFY